MQSQRLVLVLVFLLAVMSGLWLWDRLVGPQTQPPSVHSGPHPPTAPAVQATPTPTALQAPRGYRLAGVAVGEPDSFAVIEAPNGTHTLYRVDAEVPGLGRLVRIEAERVVVQGEAGQFEMWLAPAATPTPTVARSPARRAPTRKPLPPARRGGTTGGSTPSAAPGPPAS
jgi:hypothetical protein